MFVTRRDGGCRPYGLDGNLTLTDNINSITKLLTADPNGDGVSDENEGLQGTVMSELGYLLRPSSGTSSLDDEYRTAVAPRSPGVTLCLVRGQ